MTRAAVEQWLADHQAGFLARSADTLAATHAPDGTFESPAHGIVRGREAIRPVPPSSGPSKERPRAPSSEKSGRAPWSR